MKQNDRIYVTLPEETTEFLKRKAEETGLERESLLLVFMGAILAPSWLRAKGF